ncbi:putative 60s ribosomal protein L21-A [Cystobasidium minutum MCA 4210]|uniref:60S ribosomal protein eL21 n=1 Tax=Cystobasidium minutum MCA 4210 TaxID=1397322 RepID=UPI0034CD0CEC|eukprot:jgi/Rhomi1/175386/fgenesh1_kg.10_\
MPHSHGLRGRTRHLFKKAHKKHGVSSTGKALQTYHVGDIVDIVADSSEHRGFVWKGQHGKTGIVFNVSPRAVGVIIHKVVGNRYMEKRVNIRCEHVRHSKCREDFIRRVKENAEKKKQAKASGEQVNVKRIPAQPRSSSTISVSKENAIETLRPIAYDTYI